MADMAFAAIGVTANAFDFAMKLYTLFQAAVDFPETSDKLILQLEIERVRFQLWGEASGSTQGELCPELVRFQEIVDRVLQRLANLLQDSNRLTEEFGLVEQQVSDPGEIDTKRSISFVRVRNVLREGNTSSLDKPVSTFRRMRWAISSKSKFESLVQTIRGFITNLWELLTESQQVTVVHRLHRFKIQAVASCDDSPGLRMLQEASENDNNSQDMFSMALRKSILVSEPRNDDSAVPSNISIRRLLKQDFILPKEIAQVDYSRCIALYNPRYASGECRYVLIEKKRYDANTSSEDRVHLHHRLHRLIMLLNATSTDDIRTALPQCMGYWSEPEQHCWYLVYQMPFQAHSTLPPLPSCQHARSDPAGILFSHPRSLLSYLQSSFKPSLESRFTLASTLANVLSQLFGSGWLHKGIRSDNIVFPHAPSSRAISSSKTSNPNKDPKDTLASYAFDLSGPLIIGFEYSRQYTEATSIDYISGDFAQAIYRHPDYQGDVTNRAVYRMAYDVFAFGLVLAEIAWWVPMEKVHGELMRKQPNNSSSSTQSGGNRSNIDGSGFEWNGRKSREFMQEVLKRAKKELAFRVGTAYQEVVVWCLRRGGFLEVDDGELAGEFYENVVIPLESIAKLKLGN
ncbi:hypothetical protein K435DRAFT_516890 [Dendrothele bispora CBS 962.96]|uniref:Prion-inhibition and propagation HeLo domain-containing protein n=1 Tax=Dendrothele bispora (strain CBS 962.96) TaxID=1314807 RepID=A0A4S8M935_DENBC|nr:hypothetical protein K435DRAFT_516890 [Dendrothele bispora CBS 962.96]